MGVVYSARRTGEYEQRVAVKLRIERGLVDPGAADERERRFRAERQTLARLDHPNIARLFDGGTAADGTPFLVMEYVDGLPLDRHCAARGLATEERLELFRSVCGAVQYAHQYLVVHRDLKPGNILTTAEGVPKLVDFGIAKLLEAEGPDTTRTRAPLMTLEYASPEQVRGESVSTASDVYSLGVVLYELLTGVRPHELGDVPQPEALRILCEEAPEKPSAAAARRAGSKGAPSGRLKGDLDTIVLKALHKDPRQRYGSVEQLADDLRRYMAGQPVLARKDTLPHRARKFVRRHWRGVGAAVLLVLSLAGGLAGTLTKGREARAEARTAEATANFLVALFEENNPFTDVEPASIAGAELTADILMRRARERVSTELRGEPRAQTRLLESLGAIHMQLGIAAEAVPLFEELLELERAPAGGRYGAPHGPEQPRPGLHRHRQPRRGAAAPRRGHRAHARRRRRPPRRARALDRARPREHARGAQATRGALRAHGATRGGRGAARRTLSALGTNEMGRVLDPAHVEEDLACVLQEARVERAPGRSLELVQECRVAALPARALSRRRRVRSPWPSPSRRSTRSSR